MHHVRLTMDLFRKPVPLTGWFMFLLLLAYHRNHVNEIPNIRQKKKHSMNNLAAWPKSSTQKHTGLWSWTNASPIVSLFIDDDRCEKVHCVFTNWAEMEETCYSLLNIFSTIKTKTSYKIFQHWIIFTSKKCCKNWAMLYSTKQWQQ